MAIGDLWIPIVVGLVVATWFFWTVFSIRKVYVLLKKSLKEATGRLRAVERSGITSEFHNLDAYFRESPVFEHAWHEFDEALIKEYAEPNSDGSQSTLMSVSNTLAAHEFFSHDEIVDNRLGTEYNRHLPGVFTAIGILGTFVGISLGLVGANESFSKLSAMSATQPTIVSTPSPSATGSPTPSTDPSNQVILSENDSSSGDAQFAVVNEATQKLIGHIGPAFGASFLAVLFAVLLILVERSTFRKLDQHLLEMQVAIDRIFPRLTEHSLLKELIQRADQQEKSLKNLSEDFAARIEEKLPAVFGTALSSQTDMLRTSFRDNTEHMSTTLATAFQPLTEQMNQTLVEMKRDQASSSTDTLRQMADSFQNTLSNAAGSQMDEMSRAISGTAELLGAQKDALSEFVGTLSSQMVQQAETLSRQMERQQTQAEERQRESNERFQGLLGQLTSTFSGLQEATVSNSGAMLKDMSQEISGLLSETMHNQKTANQALMAGLEESNSKLAQSLGDLTIGLEKMSERITQSTDALVSRLSESTGSTMAQLSSTVQGATEATIKEVNSSTTAAVEQIAAQTAKLFEASEAQNRRLTDKFETMAALLESSSSATNGKALETTKVLESALSQVSQLAKDVGSMTQAVRTQIESLTQVAVNARESAAEFKLVSAGLSAQQARSDSTLQSMKAVERTVEAQVQVAETQRVSLQDVLSGLSDASRTLKESADDQRKTLSEVSSASQRNLTSFGDGVNATVKNLSTATQSYFRQIDESLSSAVKQLGGTVDELREPLEDLLEVMSAKKR